MYLTEFLARKSDQFINLTVLDPFIDLSFSLMLHYFQRRREEDRDGGQKAGISAHSPAQEHSAAASHTKSTDYQVRIGQH
jgi:hypothetical protein